jgi:hypothetical protein
MRGRLILWRAYRIATRRTIVRLDPALVRRAIASL